MGKDAPAQPATPDYAAAATAQGAANVDAARATAKLSNPNIISPYGDQTVTYGANGDQDIPTVTQTLTPTGQQTLNAQQQVQLGLANLGNQGLSTVQNTLNTPFNPNLPNLQTGLDTSNNTQMPTNAGVTGQQAILSRLNPQITQQNAANVQQLANQGITPGSEAYNNAMRTQDQSNNDLITQAALQGINIDQSANQQGYNQSLQSAQFGNTADQQSLQQQLQLYNQPLNEVSALESGSQIQTPQFQGYQGSTVTPAPIFGAAQAQGQNNLTNYGIQSSANNASTAGLEGLAGTAAMAGAIAF